MESLAKFWQHWRLRSARTPGYRPGVTMQRVLRELQSAWPVQRAAPDGSLLLQTAAGSPGWRVAERVQAHFLMHVATVELSLRIPASPAPAIAASCIQLHHRGWRRSAALAFRLRGPQHAPVLAMAERLCGDQALGQALQGLDFSRCVVYREPDAWRCVIEPFGGSEVVSRFPSFRRYVRLGNAQVLALQQAMQALLPLLQSACHAGE